MTDDEILQQVGQAAQRAEDERIAGEPIDQATRERFVQAILQSYPPAAARQQRDQRLRFARRGSMAAGVLALAAGVVLFVRTPAVSDLPPYEMAVVGGARELRGDTPTPPAQTEAPRIRKGDRVEILLRPQRAVEGALSTRALFIRGADIVPWDASIEHAPLGALRIVIDSSALPALAPGRWDLVVAMGRPGSLPDEPAAILRGGSRWQTHRTSVVIE
jgi:hypothetical protein